MSTPAARAAGVALGAFAAGAIALAGAVHAHTADAATAPGSMPWQAPAEVAVPLVLSALAYAVGLARAWRAVGRGRGIAGRQAAAFAVGWGVLALALVSPLDGWGEQRFSAHMLQHEALMAVAAPLLCLGRPLVAWLWLLPARARRAVVGTARHRAWAAPWRALSGLAGAWVVHAVVLWGWHVPRAFDAALREPAWHTVQHLSFLVAALLFWWSALRPQPRERHGAVLLSLFTTLLHTSALGALLALSATPWYSVYVQRAATLGLNALADQQLGGLVMWAPAGLGYLVAGLALAARGIDFRRDPAPAAEPMRPGSTSGQRANSASVASSRRPS